eukprot:scaffold1889_cov333-Pavlova_lutheri.AAC.1
MGRTKCVHRRGHGGDEGRTGSKGSGRSRCSEATRRRTRVVLLGHTAAAPRERQRGCAAGERNRKPAGLQWTIVRWDRRQTGRERCPASAPGAGEDRIGSGPPSAVQIERSVVPGVLEQGKQHRVDCQGCSG